MSGGTAHRAMQRLRTTVVAATMIAVVGSGLAVLPHAAGAATAPAPGNTGVLDISHVLQLAPPLAPLALPASTDDSLDGQMTVQICRVDPTNSCPGGVTTLSANQTSTVPGLLRAGFAYAAVWNTTGTVDGQQFRLTFRVAGMKIGEAQMRAVGLLGMQASGTFLAGVPVPIAFTVAKNPVVRTRSMHDRNLSSVDAATTLSKEFKLDSTDAFRVLYHDIREVDFDYGLFSAPSTAKMASASALGGLPAPFRPWEVIDGVVSPSTYGLPAAPALALAHTLTPLSNQTLVNALADSKVLGPNLTPLGLLGAISAGLGVTDRVAGLRLIKNASKEDGGQPFDPTSILKTIMTIRGATSLLDGLRELADVGYPAPVAMAAGVGAELDNPADSTDAALKAAILKMATAAIQVPGFPDADIVAGLNQVYCFDQVSNVYPGGPPCGPTAAMAPAPMGPAGPPALPVGPGAAATDAAKALAKENCMLFTQPVQPGSIPDTLKDRVTILPAGELLKTLVEPGTPCGFKIDDAGTVFHNLYSAGVLSPLDEATKLTEALVGAFPAATPAGDVVLAVGKTLKDKAKVAGDTVTCLTSVGVIKGANNVPGVEPGKFGLPNVVGTLDASSAAGSVFPDPFGSGAGGNLDKLGQCLVGNGLVPPLPLRAVNIRFTDGTLTRTGLKVDSVLWTARAGWLPRVGDTPAGPLLKSLSLTGVPNIGVLGKMADALTLPVMAIGPSNLYRGNYFTTGTPYETYKKDPNSDSNGKGLLELAQGSPNYPEPAQGSDKVLLDVDGAPLVQFGGPLGRNGEATMVVPALPGTIKLESTQFTGPNLICGSGTPLRAAALAAIALPQDLYTQLDQGPGTADIISFGRKSIDIDIKPGLTTPDKPQTIPFRVDMPGVGFRCGKQKDNNGYVGGDIKVTSVGSALDNLGAAKLVKDLASTVSVGHADGPDGNDVALNQAGFGGLFKPESATGNFLSMLGAAGGPSLGGPAIQSLMTTGFANGIG